MKLYLNIPTIFILYNTLFYQYFHRKLNLRQQQMDDRRRKNMNFEYGRAGSVPESTED